MIKIRDLYKSYKLNKEKVSILNDINLHINKGEYLCILGPSGCGKSTLLNILGGLDWEIEGNMEIEGVEVQAYREKDWVRHRKQRVGFIFQNFNLISHLSAKENVELAMRFNGKKAEYRSKRALELLEMVGLGERSNYLPTQLSGGQKQRVAIARALANEPQIILADEPTGALDTKATADVMELLDEIHSKNGVAIILVTHNKELAQKADRVIYMADGEIVKERNNYLQVNKKALSENGKEQVGRMSLLSTLQVGMKNLWLKKKRSILTIAGTAVGIAGMILMLGIGSGAEKILHQELSTFVGDETIWVTQEDGKETIEQEDIDRLREIEGVDLLLDNHMFVSTYYYEKKSVEGQMDVFGPKSKMTQYEQDLASMGRIPEADDSNEIVLTSQIAEGLLGEDEALEELIGQEVTIITRLLLNHMMTYEVETQMTVIGISDSGLIAGASFIPYETAQKLAEKSSRLTPAPQKGAEIRVSEKQDYDKVVEEIRALGYAVTTNKEDFQSINIIMMAFKIFLVGIAAISMFVSAIMIKIVLHTNVMERTKEIGIMGAIGAGKREIKRIFIVEAGILGFGAGIVGILIGQILGCSLNVIVNHKVSTMKMGFFQLDVQSIIMCMAISLVVAIWSGMKPAKRAAQIAPAEALRYE